MRIDTLLAVPPRESVALIAGSRTMTFGDLDAAVDRAAAGLTGEGVRPGDRVALWSPKSIESVAALFAIWRAGAVAVPVNPQLREPQLRHILDDSGARLLLAPAARLAALADPPRVSLSLEDGWARLSEAAPGPQTPAGELAALLYTSGSTGLPKGVMVTHANLRLGAESVAGYLGLAPDDRVLSVLPHSFDYGLSQLTTGFLSGATVLLVEYLTARDVVRAAGRDGATVLAGVPPLWLQLAAASWPDEVARRMRVLTSSGGRMPASLSARLRTLFPNAALHLMYGLTEAFRSTTLDPALVGTHPDSIGRAIPHAEVLVCHPDGSVCADGEPGELVHCGPLVTQGYWRDPERTAARFRPAPPASAYGGTAVWSGDTVVRGSDGLLRFVGRADEMIKTLGNRVSPTEVEEVAYGSGAVVAAAAFGVPDEAAGEAIVLLAEPSGEPDETAVRAAFRAVAPGYMMPREVRWLPALPRNPNGKIDRAALRASLT